MNSFFASVEQEMNPALRGRPIAVVPMLADTTCCIAVSYEGKAFGIKTGTKVGEAKKLCPGIQLVVGNHAHYIKYHNRIVETVESCVPVEAVCSIDEIASRLTGSQQNVNTAGALADKIKGAIKTQVGSSLRCSIGVAPNRYLAKIAADMKKPDGFTAIRPCDLPAILYPLKLRDLPGVGARMEARLRSRGILTWKSSIHYRRRNFDKPGGAYPAKRCGTCCVARSCRRKHPNNRASATLMFCHLTFAMPRTHCGYSRN
jgi:DNA polymerase-4